MSDITTAQETPSPDVENGVLYGAAAFSIWGVVPIYFHALAPASAGEILANRITWSAVFCLLAWVALRNVAWVRPLLAVPHHLFLLGVAALVLSVNWGVYIYAVTIENVVESALGYFINPIVLVLLGVFILHERLRPMQWAAVGIGTLAVLVIAVDYGRPPWIALALAFSFATYGFIKKKVGARIGALESMTVETLALAPIAAGAVAWYQVTGRGTLASEGPGHTLLLLASGVVTAVPLIFFAAAARRVPLVTMGFLQFLAPTISLIVGVVVLNEHVPPVRWAGFSLVWVALALLTIDSLRTARRRARAVPAASLRVAR